MQIWGYFIVYISCTSASLLFIWHLIDSNSVFIFINFQVVELLSVSYILFIDFQYLVSLAVSKNLRLSKLQVWLVNHSQDECFYFFFFYK